MEKQELPVSAEALAQARAEKVVDAMFANDYFSQWLGIELVKVGPGHCILQMKIRKEMLNGFSIAHGGIAYSLADSALAFASNSHGRKSLSIETSISHTVSLHEGDTILAEAKEINLTNKLGIYYITITSESNTVALFRGTVYRTSKEWF
jgi:acyl-CoA thioesterase